MSFADRLKEYRKERGFSQEELAGKQVVLEDMSGLTAADAERKLKNHGITAKFSGTGERVTGQIPAPGQNVPGGSEVLLYLEQQPETKLVEVPDFAGMNRQQASDAAGKLGLYILVTGNDAIDHRVTVTNQSISKATQVPLGTTIILEFTDTAARD